MYKVVFGMWVKPENIVVHNELAGVTFCGFIAIESDGLYLPIPVDAWKYVTSTLTPVKALPDFDALVGKIMSFQLLTHNLPDDDPVKNWFEEAYACLSRHASVSGEAPLPLLTHEMRDFLWRGGPKRENGGGSQATEKAS